MCNVLLIGNGPAALSKEMGHAIDNFDGSVVRFNNYKTDGYEKHIGTRTDIWVTCEQNNQQMKDAHKKRYYLSFSTSEATEKVHETVGAERIPLDLMHGMIKDNWYPSSGAIATEFFLSKGYDVWIWGFDFLSIQRNHHYNNDGQARGDNHNEWKEWEYFHKLEQQGKIWFFGLGKYESIPIYRQPESCGNDNDVGWYRQAAHNAWYNWFGEIASKRLVSTTTPAPPTVLDVGAGLCEGLKVLESHGCWVTGVDVDERLKGLHSNFVVGGLNQFDDNSFDYITCVDVIEHVVEDLKLMDSMKRIARIGIFVTTPCYTRSRCGNIAHCREYSIAQFTNAFKPSRVWSASPDGKVHRTLLLTKTNNGYINHSPEGVENKNKNVTLSVVKGEIPITTRFNNTVDGQEWAHICGIFKELNNDNMGS